MNYKNLDIWQLARELVIDIHKMTLDKLPKFESFEEGSQIRRYKQEFIRYLHFAIASNDETIDHLVYCLRKDFTQNVIPDLIKPAPYLIRGNPVFSAGFPFSRE